MRGAVAGRGSGLRGALRRSCAGAGQRCLCQGREGALLPLCLTAASSFEARTIPPFNYASVHPCIETYHVLNKKKVLVGHNEGDRLANGQSNPE